MSFLSLKVMIGILEQKTWLSRLQDDPTIGLFAAGKGNPVRCRMWWPIKQNRSSS